MPAVIRRVLTITAAVAAMAAVAAPVSGALSAPAHRANPKIATVGDDYFTPFNITIKKGASVKWNWLPTNGDTHNVTLASGPNGVKRGLFKSSSGAIGIKFVRKFTATGKYKFVCTFHREEMQMTVTVKKP